MRQELTELKLVVDKDKGGKGNAKVEDLPDRRSYLGMGSVDL